MAKVEDLLSSEQLASLVKVKEHFATEVKQERSNLEHNVGLRPILIICDDIGLENV